jgi:hypothetical protein
VTVSRRTRADAAARGTATRRDVSPPLTAFAVVGNLEQVCDVHLKRFCEFDDRLRLDQADVLLIGRAHPR